MSKPTVKKKNPALGRGLSALLDNADTISNKSVETPAVGEVALIPVSAIEANPFQPRVEFEPEGLEELAASIGVHGVIQPVTVRKMGFDSYQLISGERRTRAAMMAGLTQIPAYVRTANDQGMLEMALIENIQRRDLNAIEIALSYQRLIEELDLKQAEIGERVGKQRSTITNYLRLLRLPDSIQKGVKDGVIGMGHARALIGVESEELQEALYTITTDRGLSVREIEKLSKLPELVVQGLSNGSFSYDQAVILFGVNKEIQLSLYAFVVENSLTAKQMREVSELPLPIIKSALDAEISLESLSILQKIENHERLMELFEEAKNGTLSLDMPVTDSPSVSNKKDSQGYNPTNGTDWDPEIERIEEEFSERLNAYTHIKGGKKGGGQIRISYKNRQDLERILSLLPESTS